MRWNRASWIAALVFALSIAPAARASEPSIWVQCDGQPRPEGTATTAARIAAVTLIPIFGLLAVGETGTGSPAAVGQPGVDACTAALAETELMDRFWQRKLSVLRSRAVHYIEINNHDAALADLAAMRGVGTQADVASPLLDRSVGVSAQMLEATLRARKGELDRARELAVLAADARPYSFNVQLYAVGFFGGQPAMSEGEQRIFHRIVSYDPTSATRLLFRLDQTDDATAAADAWEAALAADDHYTVQGLDERLGRTKEDGPDGYFLLRAAIAMARAGRTERAEQLAARADAKLGPESTASSSGASVELPAAPAESQAPPARADDQTREDARRTQLRSQVDQTLARLAAPYRPLLRAMLLSAHGDDAGALAVLQSRFSDLPKIMATAELLRRFNHNPALASQVPEFLVNSAIAGARPDLAQRYGELDMLRLVRALPQFQRVDGQNRYRAGRNIGYSEYIKEDGTHISYAGAPAYAGGEMLLLRAAELAPQNGSDSFLVLRMNGNTMDVAYADADHIPEAYASRASRFIRASDVIANLKPIYVDLPEEIEAYRRGGRRSRD